MKLSILFGLVACTGTIEKMEIEEVTEETTTEQEDAWTLTFVLSQNSGTAGEDIPYTVSLQNSDGEDAEDLTWSLSSDSESFFWNQELVRPTVAGSHTITAVVVHEEQEYQSQATLDVAAAAAYTIDLSLSQHGFYAGEEIQYTLEAWDRFGNDLPTTEIQVELDGDATMGSELITSTTPGLYTMSASWGDLSDVEIFQVFPGPTVSLELGVPVGDVEYNETLACNVSTFDEYGNLTEDPWTIRTEGATTSIAYQNITFIEEGNVTIVAELDADPSISDSHGPIMIDSTGPLLTITAPERALWTESYSTNIIGVVEDDPAGLATLTIDGTEAFPDTAGNFALAHIFSYGTNFVETYALDNDGNDTKDIRATIAGDFQPKDTAIDDALLIYIGDSDGGLGALELYGESMISDLDLGSLLPSGNIVNESGCAVSLPWVGCVTSYSFQLRLTGASYGGSDLELSTGSDGFIHADFNLSDITINWSTSGTVSTSGNVTANSASVNIALQPYVSNNNIYVSITSISSSFGNLNFNVSGLLGTIVNFFGLDSYIESEMESYAQDAIQDAVESQLPSILEEVLQDFSIEESFEVMDATYTLSAFPSDIFVDDDGLSLSMLAKIQSDSWNLSDTGLGSLYSNQSPATWSSGTGLGIDLSLNLINQLLYQTWGSGMINLEMNSSELGLEADDISLIFPNASDLSVTVDALLPPTVVDNNGDLDLQIGDIYVAIHNGPLSDNDIRMELYIHATAPLSLDIDGSAITPTIGDFSFSFNVIYPSASSSSAQSTEVLLDSIVPYLLPNLEDAISGIELPELESFSFASITPSVDNNHFSASAVLQAN